MYLNEDQIPDSQTKYQLSRAKYQRQRTENQMTKVLTDQITFLLIKILKQIGPCTFFNVPTMHMSKKIRLKSMYLGSVWSLESSHVEAAAWWEPKYVAGNLSLMN